VLKYAWRVQRHSRLVIEHLTGAPLSNIICDDLNQLLDCQEVPSREYPSLEIYQLPDRIGMVLLLAESLLGWRKLVSRNCGNRVLVPEPQEASMVDHILSN
jgi:hypothetical protein